MEGYVAFIDKCSYRSERVYSFFFTQNSFDTDAGKLYFAFKLELGNQKI